MWVEEYKAAKFPGWMYNTQRNAINALKPFALFAGRLRLSGYIVRKYWAVVKSNRSNQSTLALNRVNLSMFLKWTGHSDLIILLTGTSKIGTTFRRKFTEAEYEKLKASTMGSPWYSVVVISYRLGLYSKETCLLRWDAISMQNHVVTYQRRDKTITVNYPPGGDLDDVLRALYSIKESEYVMPNMEKLYKEKSRVRASFKRYLDQSGLKGLTWTGLSRSYIQP